MFYFSCVYGEDISFQQFHLLTWHIMTVHPAEILSGWRRVRREQRQVEWMDTPAPRCGDRARGDRDVFAGEWRGPEPVLYVGVADSAAHGARWERGWWVERQQAAAVAVATARVCMCVCVAIDRSRAVGRGALEQHSASWVDRLRT